MTRIFLAALFIINWAGCSSSSETHSSPDMARPTLGAPITTTNNSWTWIDFPDSSCDDGTPTGIGVNAGTSDNLIVFFNGGGACWDYLTCYQINAATHGPFGANEFNSQIGGLSSGTLFDRADANNPFKDWSYVFIPYCTGDVHAGDNVATYSDNMGMDTHMYHHAGHANVMAYLPRIAATWPSPPKLVVSGSSAGGYGASFNYENFRQYWPSAQSYLLDDSGPTMEGDSIPSGYRMAWYSEWRLDKVLDPICGDPCRDDLSLAVKALAASYSKDRMSLLSSLQDQTIRTYFLLSPTGFQDALTTMAHDILDPTTNFKYFFVDGETHTMLGDVASFNSKGTALQTWLTQQVTDDPAWATTSTAP